MYLTGTDGAAYNPYAYDSFGNRIDPYTGKIQRWYNKQNNITQPFAFTGYQEGESNLYYAQARNYDPMLGRFIGEDCVRGYINCPDSINHYIYCFNDPRQYVDRNGKVPALAFVEFGIIIFAIYCGYVYIVNTIMRPQPVSVPSLWDIFPRFDSNEPSIDIIPKGNVQTPTIEAPYAEPQEETTIDVIPGGDVLAPKLLKPWETIPALTPKEPTILTNNGLNYEDGLSKPYSKNCGEISNTSNYNDSFDKLLNSEYYKNDIGYDCSEIAEDFYNTADGEGTVYRIEGKNGLINGYEYGNVEEYDYHEVYSDGNYIYDPRYSNEPVLKQDYFKMMIEINPDGFNVFEKEME